MNGETRRVVPRRFFDLWLELGQRLANNPDQWAEIQQSLTHADSELHQQVTTTLNQISEVAPSDVE